MFKNKRILITQPIIRILGGSALVTLELAEELTTQGATVTIYTCDYSEPAKTYFKKSHLKVDEYQNNPQYYLSDFDYIWVHSQILPISLVQALSSKLPSKMPYFIFLHMSGMDWLPDEKPWIYNLENTLSSLSLFISEEVQDVNLPLLDKSIPKAFYRNPAPNIFAKRKQPPRSSLKNLLIVSNHQPPEVEKAREILKNQYHINVTSLGERQKKYERFTKKILEEHDAVLTIAKTVPYCLVSGTPVYVYDMYAGGPGWLNPDNFANAKKRNFSGYQNFLYPKSVDKDFQPKTAASIASEIIEGYESALKFHQEMKFESSHEYLLANVLPEIFSKIKPRKITSLPTKYTDSIVNSQIFAASKFELNKLVSERDHSIFLLHQELNRQNQELHDLRIYRKQAEKYKAEVEELFQSKSYRLFDTLIKPYKTIRRKINEHNQ